MNIVALKETVTGERRSPLTPQVVEKLVKLGATVTLEPGLGTLSFFSDDEFAKSGAKFEPERARLLAGADLLLTVQPPTLATLEGLKRGATVAGFLDPFFNHDLVRALAANGLNSLCMELIPRTTYAQKMDALSSQASLAGYAAVVLAASRSVKAFPMMSTPAGTIPPARVFVVGAGVAGLQAIATAKRLGARVEAYDTRPVVKEQVQSLGARFVEIDVGETGQSA
ncbi:MAG TPA: NAD(P)(+) transhydrogenase (Re/Si-specific) subunit alpha, partial [Trueperaceae bacterium]|nr:NAD(P)(+) transhydrogenase (Re/Si-specific) subunit alpha [Trueperaceae bacterium]